MALTDLSDGDLRVVRGVLGLPMATAGDIAAVQGRTVSGVNRRLRQLSDAEELGASRLVESVSVGCDRTRVDRYFLTEYGQAQFGLSGAPAPARDSSPPAGAADLGRVAVSGCLCDPGVVPRVGSAAGFPMDGKLQF
jgi:hypothetical protein